MFACCSCRAVGPDTLTDSNPMGVVLQGLACTTIDPIDSGIDLRICRSIVAQALWSQMGLEPLSSANYNYFNNK